MSAQDRVQSYMKRHKIPAAFEEMMSKLVSTMPIAPYDYLIELLKTKFGKSSSVDKKMESNAEKTGGSVWTNKGEHETPWHRGSLKKKHSRTSSHERKLEWDNKVKLTSNTFKELQDTNSNMKTHKAKPDHVVKPDSFPDKSYSLKSEEELLAGEFRQAKIEVDHNEEMNSIPAANISSRKNRNPKTDSLNHQKSLREFIDKKRKETNENETSEPARSNLEDSDVESGIEICENADDLRDEGIQTASDKRKPVGKMKREKITANADFRVVVCATCAKILNQQDDVKSSVSSCSSSTAPSKSSRRSESKASDSIWATHRIPTNETTRVRNQGKFNSARTSGRVTTERTGYSSKLEDEDDEFESVSQVSGQKGRVPIWHDSEDDDENLTPRRSANVFKEASNKPGEKRVTLREEMLQTLPQAKNTVEEFLGNNAWTGQQRKQATRSSMDPKLVRSPQRSGQPDLQTYEPLSQSFDTFTGGRKSGWKVERESEEESTLAP